MRKEHILNIAINPLLEENYSIRLESHKPITFSFTYYNYKFYLIWDSKSMDSNTICLTYKVYLESFGCSYNGALEYIKKAKQRNDKINFKVHSEYISYNIEFHEDFTYSNLFTALNHIIATMINLEVDMKRIMEGDYEFMDEELERYRMDMSNPNYLNDFVEL